MLKFKVDGKMYEINDDDHVMLMLHYRLDEKSIKTFIRRCHKYAMDERSSGHRAMIRVPGKVGLFDAWEVLRWDLDKTIQFMDITELKELIRLMCDIERNNYFRK